MSAVFGGIEAKVHSENLRKTEAKTHRSDKIRLETTGNDGSFTHGPSVEEAVGSGPSERQQVCYMCPEETRRNSAAPHMQTGAPV